MSFLPRLILAAPHILFALVMHEFAHAVTSVRLGDPTPARDGRLTLNPLAHLDPLGTLMIVLTMVGGVGFGWARPVRIDPSHYKNPERGTVMVALAGPATNFLLAVFFGLPLRLLHMGFFSQPDPGVIGGLVWQFLSLGVLLNLSLGSFNLLPVPPLDGSKLVRFFLRGKALGFYQQLETYGFLILFGILLIFQRQFGMALFTVVRFFYRTITGF